MRLPKASVLIAGAIAAAAAGLLQTYAALAAAPAVGSLAPDFSLQTTAGKPLRLSDLRGKVVVLNFFATWCPPCRAETPDLVSIAGSYTPRGVTFVGIDVKESPELVSEFAGAKGVGYTLVLDRDGKVNDAYDVRAIPTTYVVGRDGRILYRQVDQLSGTVLASALNDALAGRIANESALGRRFAAAAADGSQLVSADLSHARTAAAAHDKAAAVDAAGQAIAAGVAANKKLDDLQSSDDQSAINFWLSAQQRDALGAVLAQAYQLRAQLQPSAKSTQSDLEQAALLLGQKAEDEERFAQAESYYKQAAVYAPKDPKAYDGIYLAAYEQRDYATARAAAETETEIAPKDPESWLTLASALNSLKQYDDALAAEHNALVLATLDYANHPLKKRAAYEVGRVFLKTGRTQIMAGKDDDATLSLATSSIMAPGTIVAQQADEQLAALSPQPVYVAISGSDNVATNGTAPAKLWVTVRNAAPQTRMVHLAAVNVPKKWVLSFCYDKVCDPYKSDVSLGPNSTRRVELQVVPLGPVQGSWRMTLAPGGVDQMDVNVDGRAAKANITVLAS
ncbi:MAG TPA: redoxin domain-containing protein [Candidatus Eremiobacteraceae bacterium]|nr:redoxin domain-containing protein [Candidatus Eremiobacteraceae bacterium]